MRPKHCDQNSMQPTVRPSSAKRLRRCKAWVSNLPFSHCHQRPIVRRLGLSPRATARSDAPHSNASNALC